MAPESSGTEAALSPCVGGSSSATTIAVVSDSHDDVASVDIAARALRDHAVDRVIHCGDIVSPKVVERLRSFRVDWVLGNCDSDPVGLAAAVRSCPGHVLHGWSATVDLNGLSLGVTHGHLVSEMAKLERGGCDWLVHGHSHQVRDEQVGGVRFLNPGALHRARPRTLMLIDVDTHRVRWIEVPRLV